MDHYGEFVEIINRLENNLSEVRMVWNDQTGDTYDHINENMELFAARIWTRYDNSCTGYNAVKTNYSESEFDDTLNQVRHKAAAV